jgi:hypothetical protein
VELTSGGRRAYLLAGRGMWVNAGSVSSPSGFRAGLVGGRDREVTGAFDLAASTVTVTAPYAVFGSALKRTSTVSSIAVTSRERFVNAGGAGGLPAAAVELSDRATRVEPYVLGRC